MTNWKGSERKWSWANWVLYGCLPQGDELNHKESVRVAGSSPQIRTKHLSLKRYCYRGSESLFVIMYRERKPFSTKGTLRSNLQSSVFYKKHKVIKMYKMLRHISILISSVVTEISDNIILPVVMSGCVSWSLALRHDHGLSLGTWNWHKADENYRARSFIIYTFQQNY